MSSKSLITCSKNYLPLKVGADLIQSKKNIIFISDFAATNTFNGKIKENCCTIKYFKLKIYNTFCLSTSK